ncbi:hypothetical protein KYY02_12295 [Streptomyces pimonensis]|uniref:Uncharacterized protein n=1 Tax=Streptomyces pimonensis TaxID=2860288 RepID=A0ABV4J0B6_9ACTN
MTTTAAKPHARPAHPLILRPGACLLLTLTVVTATVAAAYGATGHRVLAAVLAAATLARLAVRRHRRTADAGRRHG